MSVVVRDLSPQFLKQYRDASRMATDAAANLLQANVTKRFRQGYYTSQAFRSTAQIMQHITRDEPVYRGNGWMSVVGVPDGIAATPKGKKAKPPRKPTTVGKIALAWELGHHNNFTGKWERVAIFKPVGFDSLKAMIDTYNRVLNRYLERGKAVR